MKKAFFKRFVLLAFAVLMVLSLYPASVIEDGFSASAADSLPTWLDKATFDVTVYKEKYTDLAGMTDAQLKSHWLSNGIKEGRSAAVVFDVVYYLNNNSDLKSLYGTDYTKAYNHFINSGYKEKRKSSMVFDGSYYCEKNKDVATSYGDEYIRHYIETGMKEGRRASLTYDPQFYLFKRPDVAAAYPGDYVITAKHYVIHGLKEKIVAYDNISPVISEVTFSNISTSGYTVSCKVTDNWGVKKVAFPTWTEANDQDDLAADFMNTQLGTKSGDTYTFRVRSSDHNNEQGVYVTHIYAVDRGGNQVSYSKDCKVTVENVSEKTISLISTSWYKKSEGVISNIKTYTTVNSYAKHFVNSGLKLFAANGTEIGGTTYVGTGAKLVLYKDGTAVDSVIAVVTADVDGNGVIDTTDCLRIKMTFLEQFTLDAYQKQAADLDGNGTIDSTDYLKLKNQIINGDNAPDPDPEPAPEPEPEPEPEPDPEPDPEPEFVVKAPVKTSDLKTTYTFETALKVSDYGSTADVQTAAGISYKASGYSSYSNGKFKINSNFQMALGSQFSSSFNRISICYVSDKPLKLTATYKIGSTTVNDLFYLEAGTNTFNGLVQGYLKGNKGSSLTGITISTCEGVSANFALCYVKTETVSVISGDICYIESTIYKLGVRVTWGGGICYLYDKSYAGLGISNLINQADTGRLVQQSYYGTHTNGEYTSGYYNNAKWPYNPVQGGDCKNNPSRLIDITVSGAAIYVKAQPQDWSKNNEITPSYMENVYKLVDNFIRVDNRFVDFSGWEHRYADQELPAFYTVSYLDKFTYYAGTNSWTNDTLTSHANLPFWGDAATHNSCIFKMKGANTETWCAWTNSSNGYGIGLYVPNIDVFLAGRHAYNGSKDSKNGATNYVAPLNVMKIVSYQPIEYSYMMTTGTISAIRNTFTVHKNFATNASLHNNYRPNRLAG